jgi:hypothetical protein
VEWENYYSAEKQISAGSPSRGFIFLFSAYWGSEIFFMEHAVNTDFKVTAAAGS